MVTTKDRLASGLGSILEWYDFALYGFFAPLLAPLFFPYSSPTTGILKIFAVFAAGFAARPVGSLIFGYIADKYGRARCLKLTPLLIATPTLAIALLPTYKELGLLAPILLITLRVLQGICIGGEFSNNMVYLCESAPLNKRYFFGSLGSCTGGLGIFLASSVASLFYFLCSHGFLINYGWRIAFSFSLVIGLITYYFRRNMAETFTFRTLSAKRETLNNPLLESFKKHKLDYMKAIGLTYLSATSFYYIFMFMPNFANTILNIHAAKAFGNNALSLLLQLIIVPVVGIAADQIGGMTISKIASVLFILLSVPLFYGLVHYSSLFFYCAYIFAILSALNAGSLPGLLVDILKPHTRCIVFSFAFNICFGLLGGIVPLIGFYLATLTHNLMAPIYYLIFSALVTLLTTFTIQKELRYVN